MAGQGRPPNESVVTKADQARRDAVTKRVKADGVKRGPELPSRPPQWDSELECWASADWPEQTAAWWDTWRASPQAQTLTPTDWDFLLDTALLHAQMWSGDVRVAPELRLRVAKFGATVEDRLRLRMQIEAEAEEASPKATPEPERTSFDDRSERALKLVGSGG